MGKLENSIRGSFSQAECEKLSLLRNMQKGLFVLEKDWTDLHESQFTAQQ
jgi:hypothetical protein